MTSSEIEFVRTNVYKIASSKLREKWNAWYDETINIDMYIQTMLDDLQNQGLARGKAIDILVEDHKDLKGFSRRTIYRALPQESKRKYESDYNMLPSYSDVPNDTFKESQESNQKDESITKNVNIPPRAENIIEADTISGEEIKARTKLEKVGYDLSSESEDKDSNSLLEQINILNHRLDSVEKVVETKDEEIANLQRQLKQQSTITISDDGKDIEITSLKKELAESKKSFRDEVSVFYKEQEIPLKCFASPLTKTITVDIDMDKVKKLYGGSGR